MTTDNNVPISQMSEYANYTEAELRKVIETKADIKAREKLMTQYVDLLTEQANAAAKEANDGQSA